MNELDRRLRIAAERLLENESLTADLDDEAARHLLAWGLAWTQLIVDSTAGPGDDQSAVEPRLKALRRMMRTANRWAGDRSAMDEAADRVLLGKIYDRAVVAAAPSAAGDPQARQRFIEGAATLQGDPADLLRALRVEAEIAVGLKQNQHCAPDA